MRHLRLQKQKHAHQRVNYTRVMSGQINSWAFSEEKTGSNLLNTT